MTDGMASSSSSAHAMFLLLQPSWSHRSCCLAVGSISVKRRCVICDKRTAAPHTFVCGAGALKHSPLDQSWFRGPWLKSRDPTSWDLTKRHIARVDIIVNLNRGVEWTLLLGDFVSQTPRLGPLLKHSWSITCEPPALKNMGPPISRLKYDQTWPNPQKCLKSFYCLKCFSRSWWVSEKKYP